MPTLNFVCLANSRKNAARCVAGKVPETGEWVRPVGHFPTGELSEEDRRYENGAEPALLDLLEVETLNPVARADYQTENHLIDPQFYWIRRGGIPVADLARLVDPVAPLWFNGSETYHGKNNRVPPDQFANYDYSLRLVAVNQLTLSVFAPGAAFGNNKRRVFGAFSSGGVDYRLDVTDPVIEGVYLNLADGQHVLGGLHYVTVSLGEQNPRDDYAYKLIAGIVRGE